ncbi:MAG: hypothetical protein WBV25_09580, partial [Methylocella sp.]
MGTIIVIFGSVAFVSGLVSGFVLRSNIGNAQTGRTIIISSCIYVAFVSGLASGLLQINREYIYGRSLGAILETGFSLLTEIGGEDEAYGLYSYALLVNNNDRSVKFLGDVLNATPPIGATGTRPFRTNVFYVPMKNNEEEEFERLY